MGKCVKSGVEALWWGPMSGCNRQ